VGASDQTHPEQDGRRPLLELADVHAFYGRAHILQGVSLVVGRGEILALLGRNGAGKTTTLRSIMGLTRVEGAITFDGRPLTGLQTDAIARLGIGYVPEERRMFPSITVGESLRLAALGAGIDRAQEHEATRRIWSLFPTLQPHVDRDAARLSGGQQQMVAIARGLVGRPRLLLIDEPTQGLAPNIAAEIGRTLTEIAGEGIGVLLVEQNATVALELASRAYVLDQGVIEAEGPASEISEDEEVQRRYLAL
jgi:branched-chain amino acid transport system ATP-binding protein